MTDCSALPTVEDSELFKQDAGTINEVVTSTNSYTNPASDGLPKKTLAGLAADAAAAIQGVGFINKGEFSTLPTIENVNEVAVFEGNFWLPTEPLPYTATGSNPLLPPEEGKWAVAVTAELLGIARSLNCLNSQVIYSTDTTTVLDDVLYIYDAGAQVIWSVPALNGAGEAIVSVVNDSLITSAGTYQMIKSDTSILAKSLVVFGSVDDMQNGIDVLGNGINFTVGMELSTGLSKWRVINSAGGLLLSGGLYARPLDSISVADFGNDDTAIENASALAETLGHSLLFSAGDYTGDTVGKTVTVNVPAIFSKGALLTITNSKFVFNKGVEAGWYRIFDSPDNLEGFTNWIADVSVVIIGANVRADWFADKVDDIELIKTIPDQTNNLNQAFRSATGQYELNTGTAGGFKGEIATGVLELGQGYYRVDKILRWGHAEGGSFYRVSGFRLTGQGIASSFLIRTDMSNLEYVLFGAFYTGECTSADNFKITCYDPEGITSADKFKSQARALTFFQGDSLQLDSIWVSGAQTGITDVNGVERNGIGMQFASCVDTYISNIFVEFCVTGIAAGSAIVTGTNIEIYNTFHQAIGLGVFVNEYDDLQATASRVAFDGIQGQSNRKNAITCIETGYDSGGKYVADIKINKSHFDGFDSEFSTPQGDTFCEVITGASIAGSMTEIYCKNYRDNIFAGDSIGAVEKPLNLTNFTAQGQTNQAVTSMFVNATTNINLRCKSLTLQDFTALISKNVASGYLGIDGLHLSGFGGFTFGDANKQFFVQSGDTQIVLRDVTRNVADGAVLNQIGYIAVGSMHTDTNDIHNVTMSLPGTAPRTKTSRESW